MSKATDDADRRLACYGTLRPGQPNHHQLADLHGHWRMGAVRGRLVEKGWGAERGHPALVLDDSASPVEVSLFESDDLPKHWPRLDAFEGADYERVLVRVDTADGTVDAWIYASVRDNERG